MKNILERPKHAAFLDKVRNWVSKIAIRDACSTADIFGGCSGGLLVLLTEVLEWSLRTRTQVLELGLRDWIILFSLLVCPGLSRSVLVGDLDFSCGRTDEGTLRGPCGPRNGQKNYQFFYTSPKWFSPDKMG